MVCSWRWFISRGLNLLPGERSCIQFMQVIKIISSITSSKDIYIWLVGVSCMHIAGAWPLSTHLESEPSKLFKIQNVEIICSEWALSKPSADNVEFAANKSRSMSVSTFWLRSCGHFALLKPHVLFSIKNSQTAMIFFAVITSKHIQLFIVKYSSVIFYLGCTANSLTNLRRCKNILLSVSGHAHVVRAWVLSMCRICWIVFSTIFLRWTWSTSVLILLQLETLCRCGSSVEDLRLKSLLLLRTKLAWKLSAWLRSSHIVLRRTR